jgi:deoxyribodipyrimidine photolyase-related protein
MTATALVLGDQLSRSNPALDGAERVLLVESLAALRGRRYHRARVHLVWSAMRHRAEELRSEGREVVEIRAAEGIIPQLAQFGPVVCQEPWTPAFARSLRSAGVELIPGPGFIADPAVFAEWAQGRQRITMEFFYRRMRQQHSLLLDAEGGPEGRKWNLDSENRRPPREGLAGPQPWQPEEDQIDASVREDIAALDQAGSGIELWGELGPRKFAVTSGEAESVVSDFVANRLEGFGPWQDAMVEGEPVLFHSLLSVPLNLGLLDPLAVCKEVEAAYRAGGIPLQSAEGFIRQVIGWREYVRAMYLLREQEWGQDNSLSASMDLPAAFRDPSAVDWNCLRSVVSSVGATGYASHIERLMLLGNSMLLLGVDPQQALAWFRESFVDAADWVMAPNVIGMALHADGGVMMTKPYAAGGNYVSRMSNHCGGCRYNPKQRTGPNACPLTALYWDFLDRNRQEFGGNHRMSLALRNLERIEPDELEEIRGVAASARSSLSCDQG